MFGPNARDAPDVEARATPERLARGAYLVNAVTACNGCHTAADTGRFGQPPLAGKAAGSGGDCLDESVMPGLVCAPNITSHADGLGAWTDGEILRALREGVDKDGETLFPMMPYPHYRSMSDEDALSIVAYLRTLPPAAGKVPDTKLDFPVSVFVNFAPQPIAAPVPEPDRSDRIAYGGYLATIGGCKQCHSGVDDRHEPIEGESFAGGQVFKDGSAHVVSANLTPHSKGLKRYTREQFIGRFKSFASEDALVQVDVAEQTVMPWWVYANMDEADLGAIYDYLMTLEPFDRAVDTFPERI